MAKIGDVFKPGDEVPHSGIYRVIHDSFHTQPHDVTCIFGKKFPPCRGCTHPRFKLKEAAIHIENHDWFKPRVTVGNRLVALMAVRNRR